MAADITLRPYSLLDAPALLEAALESVTEVYPWLEWCHPEFSLSEARGWIESQAAAREAGQEFQFVIEGQHGEFLGGCGLNHFVLNHRLANLGYWVRTSASGHGVATAAVRLLAAWAFENTDFNRLEIVVAMGNTASERVAVRSGATREAVLARRLWLHNRSVDATMFVLAREPGPEESRDDSFAKARADPLGRRKKPVAGRM